MKLCYITEAVHGENQTGIGYKIHKQIEIFKENNFEVSDMENFLQDSFSRKLLSLLPFFNIKHDYKKIENLKDTDYIYIRYFFCNGRLISALKKLRQNNPNVKIIIEIPTYPYDGEILSYHPRSVKDKCTREQMKKYVDRIVTFSDDEEIFGIKTIRISNGVDLKKIKERVPENTGDKINIIGVAQLDFWHGYDRIITGLNQYYLNGGKRDINVHIVGYGKNKIIEQYKHMISEYKLEDRVFLHGKKTGNELDEIYNKCSMAFDSLGRHRSNVKYNSSLKGKEYLAKGLPIISGVKTELDSNREFKYYLRVPADDSPLNFNEIVNFHDEIYNNNDIHELNRNIRNFCNDNFRFPETFLAVIEEMKKI